MVGRSLARMLRTVSTAAAGLLVASSLLGAPAAAVTAGPGTLIVSGAVATEGQFPHHVGVMRAGSPPQYLCGGVLVSHIYVLTAAHCVYGVSPAAFVILGDTLRLDGNPVTLIRVVSIHVHPSYRTTTLVNDLAMLRLDRAFRTMGPATLPPAGHTPAVGTRLRLSGWGQTGPPTGPSLALRWAELPVLPTTDPLCDPSRPSTEFCAGNALRPNACRGDDGGGAMLGRTVIGVLSHGRYPCDAAATFTRIGPYVPWINLFFG